MPPSPAAKARRFRGTVAPPSVSAFRPIGIARPGRYPRRLGSYNVALLEAQLSAGVAPERARAVVDLFDRSIDERCALHAQVLATKRDVAELETRLSREIASSKVELVKWVVGALSAQTALLLGAAKLF
ncbi:MAG: hypothetical protein ACK54X_05785 [Burkholderiales bacterium]